MFIFHNGGVQILCKYPESVQQFRMQLLKGSQLLCDLTKKRGNGSMVSIQSPKFCQPQISNNSVSLFLNDLNSSHASYYICKLSIFEPPPFQEFFSREYLHIYGKTLFSSSRYKGTPAFQQFFSLMKTIKQISILCIGVNLRQLMAIIYDESMQGMIYC